MLGDAKGMRFIDELKRRIPLEMQRGVGVSETKRRTGNTNRSLLILCFRQDTIYRSEL